MQGINKNFFIVILFSFLFPFSSVLGIKEADAKASAPTMQESAAFSDLLKINWERIKNLDYFTSKNLVLTLPNNQEFFIDWGSVGSGDILSPFPPIKTTFRSLAEDGNNLINFENADPKNKAFSTLLKIFFKSKLKALLKEKLTDYTKELSSFDWILGIDQSPFAPFVLKLLLLSQHSFEGEGQESRRKIEIIRLLLRLIQSGIHKIADNQKSLFSYLPQPVREMLDQNVSQELQLFIEDIWEALGKGINGYEFNENGSYNNKRVGIHTIGYVFDNATEATKCFEKISALQNAKKDDFTSTSFEEEMEKLTPSTYEVIDFKDFAKYKGMTNYKFVGFKNFGQINEDSESSTVDEKYPLEKIKNEIFASTELPKILKVDISEKETWILYVSDKLTLLDTLKLSLISFLKGYEEFKQLRSKDLESAESIELQKTKLSDQEITELQKLYVDRNIHKKELEVFELKIKKADQALQKQKLSVGKDKFSQDLLKLEQKRYEQLIGNGKTKNDALLTIEKRIRELEIKASDILLEISQDDQTVGKNVFKLLLQVCVSSPELNEMFVAFKGENEKYKQIRENLLKRLTYIFKNSENFDENLEFYKYLVLTIFPEFKEEFDKLTASKDLNKNKAGLFDAVFSSLGL